MVTRPGGFSFVKGTFSSLMFPSAAQVGFDFCTAVVLCSVRCLTLHCKLPGVKVFVFQADLLHISF